MGEVVQNASTSQPEDRRRPRPASSPSSRDRVPEDKAEVECRLEAKADLAFTVAVEVLPNFELGDVSGVAARAPVGDIRRARSKGARAHGRAEPHLSRQGEGAEAADGDRSHRFRRHDRRRARSRAATARTSSRCRLGLVHPRLRGAAHRRRRPARSASQGDVPGGTIGATTSPARRRSTSRSRKSRPGEAEIDDELAKAVGLEPRQAARACATRSATTTPPRVAS